MAIDVNISGLNTVVDVEMAETALIDTESGQVIVIEDYDNLEHKPQINGVTLSGNKTSSQIGVADASHTHTVSDVTDFPSLATVATTGDYDDLLNTPTIPDAVTVTQITSTGTNIADIDIGGVTTHLYAPSGGGGATAFVAEFNVTTYADVKDAYDNDAILICTVPDGDNLMVLQFVYFDDTYEIFYFAIPTSDGWYLTELSNADGWGDGQFFFASTDVATQLADGLMSALDKQKLDGLSKRNIWYGTCSTGASQSPKSITTASGDFSLTAGNMLCVLFSHTNSLSSVSLQVDGGASKSAYAMDGTSDISYRWGSSEVVMFAYDGTKFILLEQGKASTTQYGITKLNNTVTSTSTSEAATANAVKSAYDHGGVTSVNGSTGAVTVTVPTITDTYDGTSSDGMSGKAVKSAIDALDGTVSGSAGSGKTLTAFSQTDGKVSATFGNISITKSQVSDFPTIPTNVSDLNNDSGFTATSVTRHTTTGTNIADLTIDGTTTKLYAPTGGGGTITDVEVNGTSVVTGGVAEVTVPTDTGDLTNGAGFITGYTETDPVFTASDAYGITSSDISNWNGKLDASGILNLFYPVGSYYETSDTTFDPNISWGGTWSLETEGQVHISAGTNYTVSGALTNTTDGGSKDAIVPYHNHTASDGAVLEKAADTSGGMSANEKHTHTISTIGLVYSTAGGNGTYGQVTGTKTTSEANLAHTHSIPAHTHGFTQPTISYAGTSGNTTNANLQPYIIVNRWHRTA